MIEIIKVIFDVYLLLQAILFAYLESLYRLFVSRPKKSVRNQVILITGSGHGLGKELAILFASLGAKLALIDVNKANNEQVLEEVRRTGTGNGNGNCDLDGGIRAYAYQCDVTNEECIAQVGKRIREDLGEIDMLINNAGIVNCLSINELSSQNVKKTFEVNTLSHIWMIREFLPSMIKRGSGHIVGISSIAGLMGTANLVDYCASKYAIVGLMEALECELHDDRHDDPTVNHSDIHLTTICPLAMTTGMFKSPKTRFSMIFPVIDARYVAKEAVNAILRNESLMTVPRSAHLFYRLGHIMPLKANKLLQRFFGYGVDPHKD